MNDTNNKPLDTNNSENKENKASEQPSDQKKSFKWSGLLLFVSLIFAIAGLAAAAYIWFEFDRYKQQSSASINAEISSINSKLEEKANISQLPSHIKPLMTPILSQLKTIEDDNLTAKQTRNSLSESTQKLFELYGRDKNGWQLAEVEYLLRIAQHRLVIENDFQGAEQTLQAADDKISEIADPGLLPVRVAISDERVLLKTRNRPDLVGTVLSLSRIIKQIPLLDLSANTSIKETEKTSDTSEEQNTVDSSAPWDKQILQFAKSLYKVEPLKKSITSPKVSLIDAINTLEEKLKLAKWAVLERDQKQYQQLIQNSSDIFKRYFDKNNNFHAEIYDELTRLQSLEIKPTIPDISGSLLILKGIMLKKEHHAVKPLKAQSISPKAETTPQFKQEEPNKPPIEVIHSDKPETEMQKNDVDIKTGENNE